MNKLPLSQTNPFWFDNVELRPHPWPGLNWITTIIPVPDVRQARDFYVNVFSFVPIFDLPDPENPIQSNTTRLRYRGTNFLLVTEGLDYEGKSPASSSTISPFVFYVYVDDVEAVYKKGLQSGMKSLQEPNETFWGDWRARLSCPFGYVWDIAKRIK